MGVGWRASYTNAFAGPDGGAAQMRGDWPGAGNALNAPRPTDKSWKKLAFLVRRRMHLLPGKLRALRTGDTTIVDRNDAVGILQRPVIVGDR